MEREIQFFIFKKIRFYRILCGLMEAGLNVSLDLKYNYHSYDIQNNIFYKYIARKKL